MIRSTFILFAAVAALFLILYFVPFSFPPLNNLIVSAVEKKADIDITVGDMTIWPLKRVTIKNLTAVYKKSLTLSSETAEVNYNIFNVINGFIGGHIQLKGVAIEERLMPDILPKFLKRASPLQSAGARLADMGIDFKLYRSKLLTDKIIVNGKEFSQQGIFSLLEYFKR